MRDFGTVAARVTTLASLALLIGCGEPTEPMPEFRARLAELVVPDSVLPSDTARVSFLYENSCGTREVHLRRRPSELEVEVIGRFPSRAPVCPDWLRYSAHSVDIAPADRVGDFTVIFRQPEGGDSVRVIRSADRRAAP